MGSRKFYRRGRWLRSRMKYPQRVNGRLYRGKPRHPWNPGKDQPYTASTMRNLQEEE